MRNFFYDCLSLFSFLFRFLHREQLVVLAYHDIKDEGLFKKHLKYLKTNYNIIGISQLKEHIFCNEKLPKNPLLITFDDGDYSVLTKGLPALRDHKVPACLFVITSLINTSEDFWWDVVYKNGLKKSENIELTNQKLKTLKNVKNSERLKMLEAYEAPKRKQLNTKELKVLEANNIFIGNHSHTHPMFDKCTPPEIINELKNSYQHFRKWKSEGYSIFAYPNGNYTKGSEKILQQRDIKLAFLFDHKVNPKQVNPLRISRIRSNSDMSIPELKVKASGLHSFFTTLKLNKW